MLMCSSVSGWINHVLACMGNCLGCYTKPTPVTSVDEPSKGLQTPWMKVKRASASEDIWSTSTRDLENSALHSHRSISSISMTNHCLNNNGGTDEATNNSEFVNHGLNQWNQTRLQWTATKKPDNRAQIRKPKLSWNVSYETLLGTSRRFSQAVPLSEMVEYLADIWEHEGLYG